MPPDKFRKLMQRIVTKFLNHVTVVWKHDGNGELLIMSLQILEKKKQRVLHHVFPPGRADCP